MQEQNSPTLWPKYFVYYNFLLRRVGITDTLVSLVKVDQEDPGGWTVMNTQAAAAYQLLCNLINGKKGCRGQKEGPVRFNINQLSNG